MQDGNQGEPGWVFRPGDSAQNKEDAPEVGVFAVAAASDPAPSEQAPTNTLSDEPQPDLDLPHVEWTASEYVANPKNAGWFTLLFLATAVIAAAVYLLTKDIISTVVVSLLGLIIGIFAARQPKVLKYAIDNTGIHIEHKFYPYSSFKAFSIADGQPIHYISLAPLRRFMPILVVHYDPDDEERIVNTLAEYLPYEEYKRDIVDGIARRIRF